MIRRLFFILLSFFILNVSHAQQLEISPKSFDFGKIKEEDGIVKAKYTVTNISNSPYIMTYFYSSCGCVTTEISKEPIMPKASREIEVEFNPLRRPGQIQKEVVLISAVDNRKDKLLLAGEVIPRKKSIEELYPIEVMNGVRISEDYFPMGVINQGDFHMGMINVYNSSNKTVELSARRVGDNPYGSIEIAGKRLAPNSMGQLQFGYDLQEEGAYGELTDTVYLSVNGREWKQIIKANAIGIYNIFGVSDEERDNTPKPIISPLRYMVNRGEEVIITISNNGAKELEIIKVIANSNKINYELPTTKVKKGEKIYLKCKLIDGESGEITLLINSVDSPVMNINLKLK